MSDISADPSSVGVADQRHAELWFKRPAFLALLATLTIALVQLSLLGADIEWVADNGMRLVQVRDLLAGQSWFDTTQYRMGLSDGTPMHWSRLIDAPIAAIIAVTNAITGDALLAERVAALLWPAILLFLALWALAVAARRIASEDAVLPALIIGSLALFLYPDFLPGGFDHHAAQIVLALWTIASLVAREDRNRHHALAGVFTVLMLAIGMETLPYVAGLGLWVSVSFVFGSVDARSARSFGLAVAATALLVFVLTVSPSRYGTISCDAYSIFHVTMASVGGLGLALASVVGTKRIGALLALGGTGVVVGALALTVFADCFLVPLSTMDPLLQEHWLAHVNEARSLWEIWRVSPTSALASMGIPLIAIVVAMLMALHPKSAQHGRRAATLYLLMLALAVTVSVWQVRAAAFALAFALVPMTLLVVEARARFVRHRSAPALAGFVMAWILSIHFFWLLPGIVQSVSAGSEAEGHGGVLACLDEPEMKALASLRSSDGRPVLIASPYNAAVPVLLGTDHRVLSGNYHRNTTGNLAWISIILSAPEDAANLVRDNGVTHFVSCASASSGDPTTNEAPQTLQAVLHAGNVPDWLMPVRVPPESQLRIYRAMVR